jgi:23S rRNA (cytosine1962-C5)-methyltransferase
MPFWSWIQEKVILRESPRVLNLFAYSGGSTLAAAQKGARVCHLDASKGMVSWAKENAFLNGLDSAPIRWIVDDVRKFLKREIKRKSVYDAIILDPPTFGRGPSGEVFRIETDLPEILTDCVKLLSEKPLFFLFSCHTPGYTPLVLKQWLSEFFSWPFETGEMFLKPNSLNSGLIIPSGTYARWCHEF